MVETADARRATDAWSMSDAAPIAPPDLARLRAQQPAAFTRLVDQTRRIVLGLGQSVGLNGADLDDATAETYLNVYRALPRFEGRSAVTTWVYAIAARTMSTWQRRAGRHRAAALPETVVDPAGPPPAAAAERAESDRRVWAAVAALEPTSAMAVELFYRRGLSVNEVAAVLACPAGTVKTLLFHARQVLKVTLSEEGFAHA